MRSPWDGAEAILMREWRRSLRLWRQGRVPLAWIAGTLLVGLVAAPFLLEVGVRSPAGRVGHAGTLLAAAGLTGWLGAASRAVQIWQDERKVDGFHGWILSGLNRRGVAPAVTVAAAVNGVAFTLPCLVLALILAVFRAGSGPMVLLAVPLVLGLAMLGAAIGSLGFLAGVHCVSSWRALAWLAIPGVFVLTTHLTTGGSSLSRADASLERLSVISQSAVPILTLAGLAAPGWWDHWVDDRLGSLSPVGAWAVFSILMVVTSAIVAAIPTIGGFIRLANESDRLLEENDDDTSVPEPQTRSSRLSFGNPVFTRELRTRLRSKETLQFVLLAAVAVAAGGFVPLMQEAGQLGDPLQLARAARQVFFWLTVTLISLLALAGPGLTADLLGQERETGGFDLLLLTRLKPGQILLGRLLGASLTVLTLALPSMPLFGVCYLFHGADVPQVGGVVLLILASAVVSCFCGVAQATIWARSGLARGWAYALSAFFTGFPGGALWIAVAIASPDASIRNWIGMSSGLFLFMGVANLFLLGLLWGNAVEQLQLPED